MGVYKRKLKKGVRWWYKFSHNGQTHISKAIYKTKRDCLQAESKARLNMDYDSTVKLLEVCNHRLDYLQLSRNEEYFKDQRRLSKKIVKAIGNIKITEITAQMASSLFLAEIRRCKKAGLGNSRPNELVKTLRATVNYAKACFDIEMRDPTRGIQLLPKNRKKQFIPSEELINELIESCNQDQAFLVKFVYETGCRVGEAVNLTFEDVHSDYITLFTRKSRNSEKTPRHLPRPSCLELGGKGKVFKHNAYPRFLEEKVKELGHPNWNWHSLRRRRASIWAKDKPLFEIMMLLGHSQISTTQRYLYNIGVVKL